MAQLVKNPATMQETWVWSLGWEDPFEKGMATHSSIIAWRIPWTEEPSRLQSMESQSRTRLCDYHHYHNIFSGGSEVKNPPALRETWVWSLSWKDRLEKGMATHSSILGWRIPWTEELVRLQFMESQRVGHDWAAFTSFQYLHEISSRTPNQSHGCSSSLYKKV